MSIQRLYYQWEEEAFSEKVGRDVLSGLKGLLLEDEPAKYSIVKIYVRGNALLRSHSDHCCDQIAILLKFDAYRLRKLDSADNLIFPKKMP